MSHLRGVRWTAAACTVLCLAACASEPKPHAAAAPTPAPSFALAPALPAPPAPASREPLARRIPEEAVAAAMLWPDALRGLHDTLREPPELRGDLGAFLERRLGVDVTTVRWAVAYLLRSQPIEGALFLRLERPATIRRVPAGQHARVPIYRIDDLVAAALPDGVVLGTENGVRHAIDLDRGWVRPLGPNAPLSFLLSGPPDRDLVIGARIDRMLDAQTRELVRAFGAEGALLSYGGPDDDKVVTLRIHGNPDGLRVLESLISAGMAKGVEQLGLEAAKAAVGSDIAKGIVAIYSYHKARALLPQLNPRLEGDALLVEYHLGTLSRQISVATVGVLGAAAIPAVVGMLRRARTQEAVSAIAGMHERALDLGFQNRRFPRSTSWTPAEPCCAQAGQKCAVGAETFAHPTWKALAFQPTGPVQYQYRFTSGGRGSTARFTIEARGDLDCDGTFSSFRREGGLDAKGSATGGELQSDNEVE